MGRIDEQTIGVNADLTKMARDKAEKGWVDGHVATEAETLGVLIARHYEWDGNRIMEAFAEALEDANFHVECATVRCWMKEKENGYAECL